MKTKKILSLALVVCCLLALAGCGASKTAVWEGYPELPFNEFLQEGLSRLYGEGSTVKISTVNGWDECPEEISISYGAKPVTYIIDVRYNDEDMQFHFFMESNPKTIILSIKGAFNYSEHLID